ncbi:MAG: twin-arginine translocation signal domain-containing protein [Chloroflexi bacterium]|nr:twin-arginine translocation signal domain-containing protein [Chloroflexota bacterium]
MSETRKRISRREFLQLAGVGGVTMATGAAQPALQANTRHALDAAGRASHPWWVRTVDKPTVEFNWEQIKRFDSRSTVRSGFAKYVGEERVEYLSKVAAENEKRRLRENVSGYTLKDLALRGAVQIQLEEARVSLSFLGPQRALTPEERGVSKWSGSLEESARVVRAAMRHFGAAKVGFIELNDNTRKLIYSHDPDRTIPMASKLFLKR